MNSFKIAVKLFLVMTCLTGIIYPGFITAIAQLIMPDRAHGSLLMEDNVIIGSRLIAQKTVSDRYFWPRPSAIDFDPMKPSGGSNLGPISQKLKDAVEERKAKLSDACMPEMVYASGSGLDPHISLEAAFKQVPRVARARGMNEQELCSTIEALAEGRQCGIFGPRYINVLLLNKALDDRRRRQAKSG